MGAALPYVEPSAVSERPDKSEDIVITMAPSDPPRQLRFLVVDDTEDMRDVLVRMIERAGHLAVEAADGVEATLALSENRFDVMLLDLSMPRMSGEDVVRWLHAHPDRADGMRTAIVTAWAGERRGTLQELGVTTVLAKPFRRQQLIDLIAEVSADHDGDAT
jgi:CheY-like chemotaxis protein